MLLDSLKDFSWYNEPSNVRFVEEGMLVETEPQTDFWAASHHNFRKDDGHFFYTEKEGNFEMIVCWRFGVAVASDQCGLMVRFDNQNWGKVGFLSPNIATPQLGCVVTVSGYSDWSAHNLPSMIKEIWYKVLRRKDDFIFLYSLDGEKFMQLRLFHLGNFGGDIKAGAYCCSPQNHKFECVLKSID